MRKLIDRILTSSVWVQLGVLLVLLVVAYFIFWFYGRYSGSEQFFVENNQSSKIDGVWYIIARLLDPGYIGDSKSKGFALSITLIGWVICTGLLIAIITNAYFERIKKIESGLVQYRFKNHLVVIGYDAKTIGFINDFWKFSPKNEVVVLTEQNAQDVLCKLRTQIIKKKQERKLIVLHGSRDVKEEIRRLRVHAAYKIIVLGEKNEIGKDVRNIGCFELISKLIQSQETQVVSNVYVHFEEVNTFQLAKDYDISKEPKRKVEFYPFNFYEQWAQRVFINYASLLKEKNDPIYSPLDWEPITSDNKKNVHLILLGYNRMSVALAIEAAKHCHFPNGSTSQITFVDIDAHKSEQRFRVQYSGVESLYDIKFNFIECNVFDNEFRSKLQDIVLDGLSLPYIAVCFDNSDFSLEIGLNLPKIVYQQRVPVIIRQGNYHHILDSVYTNVRFFGMLEFSTIPEDVKDVLANKANMTYNLLMNYPPIEWNALRSSFKMANRGLVDNYPFILRSFNRCLDEILNSSIDILGDVDLNILSELEHRRWMAERVFSGWTYGEERNDILKIHPDLVHYSKLRKKETEKDDVLAKQIFSSLKELEPNWLQKLPSDDMKEHYYVKIAKIKAAQLSESTIVETLENPKYRAKEGDYLCVGGNNEKWVVDEDNFKRKYELSLNEQGSKGFMVYSPVRDENIIKASVLTTSKVLLLNNGQKLIGKIGDYIVVDEKTNDRWIVDYEIFRKSYVPIANEVSIDIISMRKI